MKQIIEYYKIALLPASVITIVIHMIWGVIEYDPNDKSEWMTSGIAVIGSIMMVIINAAIIAVLSLTILFNNLQKVRNHSLVSFITWFFVPMIWIGYFFYKALLLLVESSSGDWDFLLLNTIPYVIGLIWGFTKFKIDMEKVRKM